uniref:Uncharacterized protein n=1 Tax=Lygus hesperus TaxID=30085 RepID=A0A146MFZ4_LYGHE
MPLNYFAFVLCMSAFITFGFAQSIYVNTSINETSQTYDGKSFVLNNFVNTGGQLIEVSLLYGTVKGNGLTFSAPSTTPPTGKYLKLNVSNTQVNDATITFSGFFPAQSIIIAEYTNATMSSNKPVFSINNLHLTDNVTFTIVNTQGTYSSVSNAGYVIDTLTPSETPTIHNSSGFFIINAKFQQAKGILRSQGTSPVSVVNGSSVTVDYCTCKDCAESLINLQQGAKVDTSSMLRILKDSITGSNTHILNAISKIEVSGNSLAEFAHLTSNG